MSANDQNSKEVFISYCTKNTDDATYLCNMLEGSGVTCWMAPRDIPAGGSWAESIMTGLESCKVVAFLLSEASLASKEVAKEIDIANGFQKEILQVRIQNAPLTGAFRYHLSSKQWVDAYEDSDRSERFHPTHSAILKMLNKTEVAVVLGDKTVNGQAQSLIARLNQEHGSYLDKLNTMFSLRQGDSGVGAFSIFLPLRVGATGVDLVCEFISAEASKAFNSQPDRKDLKTFSGPMFRIYANAASDGDFLKDPFGHFVKEFFPEFKWKDYGRRWAFCTLIPATELTTPFLAESDDLCFVRFESHILEISNRVISKLLDWLCYASELTDAIEMLEARLSDVFPQAEGWRVGAAEGGRLSGFLSGGKINIYKESWVPQWNNYHDRGQLCFSLESESNFLQALKIGILKYDTWVDLGEFGQSIFDEGSKLNLAGNTQSAGYIFEYKLAEEWRDSGFAQAKLNWRDKYELFVDYIVNEFAKLKPLEALLEKACVAVPALQDKDPAVFPESDLLRWDASPLYVRNRLRLMTENIKNRCQDTGINVQYRYRYKKPNQYAEWMCSELLLMVQVGNFDVAIEFRFNAHDLYAEIVSLYPPDFESVVTNDFIRSRHPEFSFSGISRLKPEKTCHGLSVSGWMDKVQDCIESQVDACISVLADLPGHLSKCQDLSEFCCVKLAENLTIEDGWVFENRAKSLEADEPILLYRKSWLVPSQDEGALPPVVVQLVPNKACFEDLSFQIKLMCQSSPEMDRAIGKVFGACEFFLGTPDADHGLSKNDWSKRLDPSVGITGGSEFSKPLIDGDAKEELAACLRDLSSFVRKIEPMLAEICRISNG